MNGLTIDNVSVKLGGKQILSEVAAHCPAGAVTVLIGPNGAGKSTLLAVAAGERKPLTGSVTIGQDRLADLSVKQLAQRRAVMPQETIVAFPFTVREVVTMGRIALTSRSDDDAVMQALTLAGITEFADRTVDTLSGGEHQRVAFARVIAQAMPVGSDSVILLDEPTAAMDIAHAEATLTLARDLAHRGAAVVMVLHDLDAAAAYADQLILLHHGRIYRAGTVAEVCTAEQLSEVYGTAIEVVDHDGRLRVAPHRARW